MPMMPQMPSLPMGGGMGGGGIPGGGLLAPLGALGGLLGGGSGRGPEGIGAEVGNGGRRCGGVLLVIGSSRLRCRSSGFRTPGWRHAAWAWAGDRG